jgi:hypothetical protein
MRSTVHLEKLVFPQLVKKCPEFFGTRRCVEIMKKIKYRALLYGLEMCDGSMW